MSSNMKHEKKASGRKLQAVSSFASPKQSPESLSPSDTKAKILTNGDVQSPITMVHNGSNLVP